ncbi:hypothetical protein QFZ49_003148 [Streptomyces turgidiscabies]|uniref:Transposase n=1 Tax=Streptomyces turgidiscabies TaxID=85558 RepID=A0ABU0RNC2_9ACTN|nr:hypothetical protein [Streptomyces turgidiscabies]
MTAVGARELTRAPRPVNAETTGDDQETTMRTKAFTEFRHWFPVPLSCAE